MKRSDSYQTPDVRWDIFGAKSYEEYIERFVVPGRFHNDVPDEIQEEYLKVEHIQAQAYYHYSLYDEAFGQALRLMEMVVKKRLKQFNMPLDYKNRKGKKSFFGFEELVEKLDKKEPNKKLIQKFKAILALRNYKSHPEEPSYGLSQVYHFKGVINQINEVFQPDELFEEIQQQLNGLISQIEQINKHLWMRPTEEKDKSHLAGRFTVLTYLPFVKEPVILIGFQLQGKGNDLIHEKGAYKSFTLIDNKLKLVDLENKEVVFNQVPEKLGQTIVELLKTSGKKNEEEEVPFQVKEAMLHHIYNQYITSYIYDNCWD